MIEFQAGLMTIHRDRCLQIALLISVNLLGAALAEAQIRNYVATFSPEGTLLNCFDTGLESDQTMLGVDVDQNGNYWVGRINNISSTNNPTGKLVKHSPTGAELLEIDGVLARPRAIAFDSLGNVYVAGHSEPHGKSGILKFLPDGSHVTTFGVTIELNPEFWTDVLVTADDKIIASGTLGGTLAIFDSSGATLKSLVYGASRGPFGLALSSGGNSFWNLDLANGSGPDFLNEYDLDLSVIRGDETTLVDSPWDNIRGGLVLNADGQLLLGASTRDHYRIPVVHHLSSDGAVMRTQYLYEIDRLLNPIANYRDVLNFAVTPEGNYVVGFITNAPIVPEPSTPTMFAGIFLAILRVVRPRREASAHQSSERSRGIR